MRRNTQNNSNQQSGQQSGQQTSVTPRNYREAIQYGKRARGDFGRSGQGAYAPPEDWHEPSDQPCSDYQVITQEPGEGYRHVLTESEVRQRLEQLPQWMLQDLEVVQLSRLTRKKLSFSCYGMQWGPALYLYPMDETLIEFFPHPPKPAQLVEAKMYGATWFEEGEGEWSLHWTEKSAKDFYLNNVLIHELGHLLDTRNTGYVQRERYAEWFAIEHGYRPSRRAQLAAKAVKKVVRKRHHKS